MVILRAPGDASVTTVSGDADSIVILRALRDAYLQDIYLEHGHNSIGRGWAGLCDRRISRQHASVSWAASSSLGASDTLKQQHVWVECTGTNPMQVRRSFGATIRLNRGDAASLCHGDEVQLLPGLFPFRVEIHDERLQPNRRLSSEDQAKHDGSALSSPAADENQHTCPRKAQESTVKVRDERSGKRQRTETDDTAACTGAHVEDIMSCVDAQSE